MAPARTSRRHEPADDGDGGAQGDARNGARDADSQDSGSRDSAGRHGNGCATETADRQVSWQGSLFDQPTGAAPGPGATDLGFAAVHRHWLDERCWLDLASGWLPGHADLFDWLRRQAPWQQRERWMYERSVLEPRLVASWSGETLSTLPADLGRIRAAVSDRYGVDFDSVLVNFYRDGRDGVAWHGDTVRRRLPEAVVVTVALGERRRFLLRPGDRGPATLVLHSGEGDLVVMGGRTQHEWQHTVPKERHAGARMSITLRHSQPLPPG